MWFTEAGWRTGRSITVMWPRFHHRAPQVILFTALSQNRLTTSQPTQQEAVWVVMFRALLCVGWVSASVSVTWVWTAVTMISYFHHRGLLSSRPHTHTSRHPSGRRYSVPLYSRSLQRRSGVMREGAALFTVCVNVKVNSPWSQWTPYIPRWHVSQAVPSKPLWHWHAPVPLVPSTHSPLPKQGWPLGPGHGSQCCPKNPPQHLRTWRRSRALTPGVFTVCVTSDVTSDVRWTPAGRSLCSRSSADVLLQTSEWTYTSSSSQTSADNRKSTHLMSHAPCWGSNVDIMKCYIKNCVLGK